jgi:HSP20 family protein
MSKTTIMKQTEDRPAAAPVAESRAPERGWLTPAVNVTENKDGFNITADLPGVNKSGLEITLDGDEIILTGRREDAMEGAAVVHRESAVADFRRVFQIEPGVDTAKITAHIEDGVLTLFLPKREEIKPRTIRISE